MLVVTEMERGSERSYLAGLILPDSIKERKRWWREVWNQVEAKSQLRRGRRGGRKDTHGRRRLWAKRCDNKSLASDILRALTNCRQSDHRLEELQSHSQVLFRMFASVQTEKFLSMYYRCTYTEDKRLHNSSTE